MNGFDRAGTIMFLVAFGVGVLVTRAAFGDSEGAGMMIAGPLLVVLDLGWRRVRAHRGRAPRGGTFLLLPLWAWGLFWTGLGAWYQWGA